LAHPSSIANTPNTATFTHNTSAHPNSFIKAIVDRMVTFYSSGLRLNSYTHRHKLHNLELVVTTDVLSGAVRGHAAFPKPVPKHGCPA
jgi:hypothetical protein